MSVLTCYLCSLETAHVYACQMSARVHSARSVHTRTKDGCCLCTQARCERKQREEHEAQQLQVTAAASVDSLAGGMCEVSFTSTEESKLEGEIKHRASQASMLVPGAAPRVRHLKHYSYALRMYCA
jgi:hypothetical protein